MSAATGKIATRETFCEDVLALVRECNARGGALLETLASLLQPCADEVLYVHAGMLHSCASAADIPVDAVVGYEVTTDEGPPTLFRECVICMECDRELYVFDKAVADALVARFAAN